MRLHHNKLFVLVFGERTEFEYDQLLTGLKSVQQMENLQMNKPNNQCQNYSVGEKSKRFSLLVSHLMAFPNPDLSPFDLTLTFIV